MLAQIFFFTFMHNLLSFGAIKLTELTATRLHHIYIAIIL